MQPGPRLWLVLCLALTASVAAACQTCRPQWQAAVYNRDFAPTLGTLLLPLAVIAAVAVAIHRSDERK
jgi:FtsH-binding integral membrane protein